MHKSKDNANKVDPEGTYTPSLINCYWYFSSCEHLYFRVVQNWVGPVVFFRWPWHAEAANIPHTPMYFPLATWSCVVMEPLLHILHCVTHGTWEFCRLTRTWPFPQVRLHWPRISVASTAEADSLSGFLVSPQICMASPDIQCPALKPHRLSPASSCQTTVDSGNLTPWSGPHHF
jgi:hypothetical protein